MPRPLGLSRREALLAGLGAASLRAGAQAAAAPDPAPWAVRAVPAGEPMRQLHAGGPSGLLGSGAGGSLWALSLTGGAPRRIADGIDAATPIATGHGRIAARRADGGLWVWEDAREGGRARIAAGKPVRARGSADPAAGVAGGRLAALGDTVGGFHRWLAPTTDGRHLVAVHTPHIGGVLHIYQHDGEMLSRRRVVGDVSTHRIGTRETDLAAWLQGLLILPSQDGRRLRRLNPAADWAELTAVTLSGRVSATTTLTDPGALALLLDGGQVVLAGPRAIAPSRR